MVKPLLIRFVYITCSWLGQNDLAKEIFSANMVDILLI